MIKETRRKVITCYSYACVAKTNSTGELVFNLTLKTQSYIKYGRSKIRLHKALLPPAYQGVRNVSFFENVAYVLNKCSLSVKMKNLHLNPLTPGVDFKVIYM